MTTDTEVGQQAGPCPVCGRNPIIQQETGVIAPRYWEIFCTKCTEWDESGPPSLPYSTGAQRHEAITEWNDMAENYTGE